MVSSTKQTERRRRMKAATARGKKADRAKTGTPKFPIHQEAAAPAAAAKK